MFRPIDLARAVGVSTQTVRGYEQVGFLPQAERTSTGQRRYGPRHVQAIQTARTMIAGYGWQHALEIMRVAHQGNLAEVVAQVDARHAELAQQRQDIDTVLAALQTLGQRETEPERRTPSRQRQPALLVSAAARQVGVRPSALRFWEAQGLLYPEREHDSHYRRYPPDQMRRLQMIVLLRKGGYGFRAIQSIFAELSVGTSEQALAAIEGRRQAIIAASQRCMEATAALWGYLQDWPP